VCRDDDRGRDKLFVVSTTPANDRHNNAIGVIPHHQSPVCVESQLDSGPRTVRHVSLRCFDTPASAKTSCYGIDSEKPHRTCCPIANNTEHIDYAPARACPNMPPKLLLGRNPGPHLTDGSLSPVIPRPERHLDWLGRLYRAHSREEHIDTRTTLLHL